MKRDSANTYRIKNLARALPGRDYRYGLLSFFVLALAVAVATVVQTSLVPTPYELLVATVVGALVMGIIAFLVPLWIAVLQLGTISVAVLLLFPGVDMTALAVGVGAGVLLAPALQMVEHWDKAVVLRLGKFHRVRGPGLHLLLPVVDRIAHVVDTRIRATDFSAEKTLTRDTVPVHVDALTFWMIWEPKLAVLEVENFTQAVVLSAQTALRDAIGRSTLAELLSERERIGREIQQLLDAKTNP